jgi:hypothetical protein
MPTADQHQSSEYIKLMYIGDSGTGKTGSMVSLLKAGYKFKILDMDAGLGYFINEAKRLGLADRLKDVEYETYRDTYVTTPAGISVKGQPKAATSALAKLQEWSDIIDPMTVLVIDSLSAYGKATFEWARFMNPTAKDPRQWYHAAQQMVEATIANVTNPVFSMNVIVISHVNYKEVTEGVHKGYANAIGTALGPLIPRYFDTMILAESSGSGKNTRRKIKTLPTGIIDLKIAYPEVDAELPLETGLADIFHKLKEKH